MARWRSHILMVRWYLLGIRAAPTALVRGRVTIYHPRRVTMAPHSTISPGSYIKCVPGVFYLGEFAMVGEGCWISSTKSIRIGRDALIGPGCVITDANHGFAGLETIRTQARIAQPVVIGEGAWLGAGVKVLAGVTVGDGAVVGAGAVVTRDVPDNAIVVGVPARIVGHRDHDEVSSLRVRSPLP